MCALHKRVKVGGSYYKGYELIVSSATGDYVLDMSQTGAATVNSLLVTADEYGEGDYFTVSHMNSDTNETIAVLADTIYNPGANVSLTFDFPALESLEPNEPVRLAYTNTATTALNLHVIVEYVGLTKTS